MLPHWLRAGQAPWRGLVTVANYQEQLFAGWTGAGELVDVSAVTRPQPAPARGPTEPAVYTGASKSEGARRGRLRNAQHLSAGHSMYTGGTAIVERARCCFAAELSLSAAVAVTRRVGMRGLAAAGCGRAAAKRELAVDVVCGDHLHTMTELAALPSPATVGLAAAPSQRLAAQRFVTDHPGWFRVTEPSAGWCRLAAGNARGPLILTSPGLHVAGQGRPQHSVLRLSADAAALLPASLATRLRHLSPVLRVPTPTVWEAAATAVIRQVVHRDQAKVAFARVCELFGPLMLVAGEPRHGFPTAEAITELGAEPLRAAGIGFKARTLTTFAEWCLDAREHLAADDLHASLLEVRGIGPWTAAVTVCDRFSDFGYYPVDDLAVRAHARTGWPQRRWPDSPAGFAREWRAATAPFTAEVTAFLLADTVLSGA